METGELVKRSSCGKFQPTVLGELLGPVWKNSLTIEPLWLALLMSGDFVAGDYLNLP